MLIRMDRDFKRGMDHGAQIGSEYSSTVHFWTIRLGIAIRGKIYD
jgi:hypothetical protein